VKVDSLRTSTGLKIAKVGLTVSLELPPEAVISSTSSLVATPRLARGKTVTVSTLPTETTLDAELAKPGALTVDWMTL
jgi:hypothetical protein